MSFRTWLYVFALGITLAGSGQAWGQSAPENSPENQPSATAGDDSAAGNSDQSNNLISALNNIETAIRDLIAEEDKIAEDEQKSRESRDLQAQERMALWAMLMFFATAATVLLTYLALRAIVKTLHQTKRAADYTKEMLREAQKTTIVAQDSVTVTREMGEAQTRAYLTVNSAELIYSKDYGYSVKFVVENVGNSPAYDVRAVFVSSCDTIGIHPDKELRKVREHPLANMIGSASDKECSFGVPNDSIVDAAGNVKKSGRVVMVELIISYRTVFSKNSGPEDLDTCVRLLDMMAWERRDKSRDVSDSVTDLDVTSILMDGWMDTYRGQKQSSGD